MTGFRDSVHVFHITEITGAHTHPPPADIYNPKSEKVGTVWKTQIKKESSDF